MSIDIHIHILVPERCLYKKKNKKHMIITLTPDDIIKRCLWTSYRRFALRGKSETELEEIVRENKPIAMDEEMGYVIGLLKVIETDNLVHRFNSHMIEILKIKSTIKENELFISIRVIEMELDGFRKRFPQYWNPETDYQNSLVELKDYIDVIESKLSELEIHEYKVKDKLVKAYSSKEVKKLIEKS